MNKTKNTHDAITLKIGSGPFVVSDLRKTMMLIECLEAAVTGDLSDAPLAEMFFNLTAWSAPVLTSGQDYVMGYGDEKWMVSKADVLAFCEQTKKLVMPIRPDRAASLGNFAVGLFSGRMVQPAVATDRTRGGTH